MAKIVVECSNPNDMDEVEALVDQVAGKCNVTYFKQHQGMVEAGTSKSKSESARIIAEDTEESHGAVRKRIERGEKESGQPVQQNSITPDNQESTNVCSGCWKEFQHSDCTFNNLCNECDPPTKKFDSGRGGQREGAGRKPKPRLTLYEKEKIIDEDFKRAFDAFYWEIQRVRLENWKTTSKEAALQCAKLIKDLIEVE